MNYLPSMKNGGISTRLSQNQSFLVFWCILAAFGAYFCTYAFRKPFSTGLFSGHEVGQLKYKALIIIAQVLGYMLSKFIGVKVISELRPRNRIKLIVLLVCLAQVALVLFALVPPPFNIFCMFLNGLPLGMVFGVIFSFLEGRRFTELLGMGLSVNTIMTSGILKTLYSYMQQYLGLSEFYMPFVMGFLFLPPFLLFVWMLAQIPPPTAAEQVQRMTRKPMSKFQKRRIWIRYSPGLIPVIACYAIFTTLRDFRDNFAIEIWQGLSSNTDVTIFAKTESIIALIVMLLIGLLVLIRKSILAYNIISFATLAAMLLMFVSTKTFIAGHWFSAFHWMVALGICFYLPYLLLQIAFFERLIAVLKLRANAGFFVYLCDSIGYLGSVFLLLYKEFLAKSMHYDQLLVRFASLAAIVCFFLIIGQYLFFSFRIRAMHRKSRPTSPTSSVQLAN